MQSSLRRIAPPAPRPAGSGLARFNEIRGRRVFEATGAIWCQYRGAFYISLPYQAEIDPDPAEVEELLRSHRVVGVRFPSRSRLGTPGGLFVCRPKGYGLDSLDRKQRTKVCRGLENCEVRRMDPSELRVEGIELNHETMARQHRYDPEFGEPAKWLRFVGAVEQCACMEVTGAFVAGRLAAYVIACREDGWLHLLYKMSRNEYLNLRTNYALDFWILRSAGSDPSIEAVSNSFQSVAVDEGLDEYKRRLGYRLAPYNMVIQLHPAVAPLLTNRLAIGVMRTLAALRPADQRLELLLKVLMYARVCHEA